ncbi:hypothetical protein IIB50_00230 [Patescibacteria group bacterium]|nr:hypothetical protein [Patescibacteria group bacterium]
MFRRNRLGSSHLKTRRKKLLLYKFILFVVIIILSLGALGWLMGFDEVTIQNIVIKGHSIVDGDLLHTLAETHLTGSYFFLFPKNSIFIYPKHSIEASVLESFKRIKKVSVSFTDFQSIVVEVEERQPDALWCDNSADIQGGVGECYFLDDRGVIFAKAPVFSGNIFFRYYGAVEGNPIGNTFLLPDEFSILRSFILSLYGLNISPIFLSVIDKDDIALYMEGGNKILFGRKQNLSDILSNLESILASDEFKDTGFSEIEYLDVRFGNKAYYKYRE